MKKELTNKMFYCARAIFANETHPNGMHTIDIINEDAVIYVSNLDNKKYNEILDILRR